MPFVFALSRYSVFFAVEQALFEAVADNGEVIDMHLSVLEFERERIGVSLHRDKIGNIEALLLAEHSRIDINPLASRHDLLVELAEHRRGTEKHTAKPRNRNEELSDSEHCDTDSGACNIDSHAEEEKTFRNMYCIFGITGIAYYTNDKIYQQSRRNDGGDKSINHSATPLKDIEIPEHEYHRDDPCRIDNIRNYRQHFRRLRTDRDAYDAEHEEQYYRHGARYQESEHHRCADKTRLCGVDYLNDKKCNCADYVNDSRYICYFWQNFVFHIYETRSLPHSFESVTGKFYHINAI